MIECSVIDFISQSGYKTNTEKKYKKIPCCCHLLLSWSLFICIENPPFPAFLSARRMDVADVEAAENIKNTLKHLQKLRVSLQSLFDSLGNGEFRVQSFIYLWPFI